MATEFRKEFATDESSSDPENGAFEMQTRSKLGGTEADEQDMRMLGRTQQLNVRNPLPYGKKRKMVSRSLKRIEWGGRLCSIALTYN
jgi:hypothetical protein